MDGVFRGLAGLLRGISGNPEEQPCTTLLQDLHSISNYFYFRIGLHKMHGRGLNGSPKMHERFRIGLPKVHERFRIVPPQVSLNLLPLIFHSKGILLTIAIMKERQQKTYLKYNDISSGTNIGIIDSPSLLQLTKRTLLVK